MIMEILTGSGGDSVLFARYTGGILSSSTKDLGGFCPGGILSYTQNCLNKFGSGVKNEKQSGNGKQTTFLGLSQNNVRVI